MSHAGKTVLVTGGAGGLGRAIADNFISLGANVVICDINKELLADFISKSPSTNTLAIECDITSESALNDLFARSETVFGTFDYVINSAGVMDMFNPAGGIEKQEWDRVIAINLTAPTFVTKRAVNGFLKAEKKGAIVNIASIASFRGFAQGVAYTASKHGLLGLTRNTAAFYRSKGIRCNAIQTGGMHTNISSAMANGYNEDGLAFMQKNYLGMEGGYVELSQMANLVAYLCSEEATLINGAVVTADGGLTAA